jgi:hypothetical protein
MIVELKQQTPILHFQPDESGATLRASEVKPKLDRFLINQSDEAIPQDWFLKKSDNTKLSALNYKVHFQCNGEVKRSGDRNCKLNLNHLDNLLKVHDFIKVHENDTEKINEGYFGNMSSEKNRNAKAKYIMEKFKETLFCEGTVTMTILCFVPELLAVIHNNIEKFFFAHNFGTRQDKGFGGFIVKSINNKEIKEPKDSSVCEALCKMAEAKCCYYFIPKYNAFQEISKMYQVMKSGYKSKYHRSILFEYFHKKGIGNEKAFIKSNGITPRFDEKNEKSGAYYTFHSNKDSEDTYEEKKYVRALLGLSENFRYLPKGDIIMIEHQPEQEDNKIERFASPVFFKVIGNTIYIVAKRIDDGIYGKEFSFNGNGKTVQLKTPENGSFDIDDFMEYFLYRFNNRHSSDGKNVPALKDYLAIGYSKRVMQKWEKK